ncbi:hypothetical protein EJ06DRAFT_195031 [Trichodelitschia bisporula]|uniref:Uncharacterized protein n=1 Tax=Trichodelitschia bisporula TaxID=703511 RepID=A0A6G1I8G2_9PEZI|nr:hypothetical protein EJ06DRAFT_195031 [Trichodelitschia bisporula]
MIVGSFLLVASAAFSVLLLLHVSSWLLHSSLNSDAGDILPGAAGQLLCLWRGMRCSGGLSQLFCRAGERRHDLISWNCRLTRRWWRGIGIDERSRSKMGYMFETSLAKLGLRLRVLCPWCCAKWRAFALDYFS